MAISDRDEFTAQTNGELSIQYERDGVETTARVSIESRQRSDAFGELVAVGWLGLYHHRPQAMIALADRTQFAYRAGLRTGDRVTEVAGEPVADWYALKNKFSKSFVDDNV